MRFIKILPPDFRTKLNLPPNFVGKLASGDYSRKAVIATCLGKWNVKVGKEEVGGNGMVYYFYGKEWISFVDGHALDELCLLLFQHQASFHFHVTIYDASACQKLHFPPTTTTNEETSCWPPQNGTDPKFTKTLISTGKRPNYYKLVIPSEMWMSTSLKQKSKVILMMPSSGWRRREWQAKVGIYSTSTGNQHHMVMGRGWTKFVRDNGLKEGDKCTFEIIMDASHHGYPEDVAIFIVTKQPML